MVYWRSSLFRWQRAFYFEWHSWDYLCQVCCCETEEKLSAKCTVRMEEYLDSVLFTMMGLRGQNSSLPSPAFSLHLTCVPFRWTRSRKQAFPGNICCTTGTLWRARQMIVWTCAVRKMAFNQSQENVSILGMFHEPLLFEVRIANEYYWKILQISCVCTLNQTQTTLSVWHPHLPLIHMSTIIVSPEELWPPLFLKAT